MWFLCTEYEKLTRKYVGYSKSFTADIIINRLKNTQHAHLEIKIKNTMYERFFWLCIYIHFFFFVSFLNLGPTRSVCFDWSWKCQTAVLGDDNTLRLQDICNVFGEPGNCSRSSRTSYFIAKTYHRLLTWSFRCICIKNWILQGKIKKIQNRHRYRDDARFARKTSTSATTICFRYSAEKRRCVAFDQPYALGWFRRRTLRRITTDLGRPHCKKRHTYE